MIVKRERLIVVDEDHRGHKAGFCTACGERGWVDKIEHHEDCPLRVFSAATYFDISPAKIGLSDLFVKALRQGLLTEPEFDRYIRTIKDKALDERGRTAELFQNNPMFNRIALSIADTYRTRMLDRRDLGCLFRAVLMELGEEVQL